MASRLAAYVPESSFAEADLLQLGSAPELRGVAPASPLSFASALACRADALHRLVDEAIRTADHMDWDGEGADPLPESIREPAFRVAEEIAACPDLPIPDVGPDPGGTIDFEWTPSEGAIYSLAVGPDGGLVHASYDRVRGIDECGSTTGHRGLPPAILEGIRRIHGA